MIILPTKFKEANNQAEKLRDVLVSIEDETFFAEESSQADWTANTGESNVDYTSVAGDVSLDITSNIDTWLSRMNGPVGRVNASAVEYNGKIYVFGGLKFPSPHVNELWEYDIAGNSWTQLTSGATARESHSAVVHNGKMYIYGGRITGTYHDSVYEYDIAEDSWTQKTSGQQRRGHSAVVQDGKMIVFGGHIGGTTYNTVYEYDIAGDSWTQKTSGATIRLDHSAVVQDGKMYVFGGYDGSPRDDVWEYDITGDSWTQKTSGATTRANHTAVVHLGKMYIYGGWDYSTPALSDVWEYNIAVDSWAQKTGSVIRSGHVAAAYSGYMFVYGGQDTISYLTSTYRYSMTNHYEDSGYIITDEIDLGSIPVNDGEWVLSDITPDDSTIVFEAWYSTTGVFGGEEVSIGVILDGGLITDRIRYWKVKASLARSGEGDQTSSLQSIKVDFTSYRKFNKIPDLGYEPLVDSVSSLTSKVDLFKPTSIGQISVGINMTDAISDWVYNDTLYNKIVRVELGFKYDGLVEADYIHYFSGAIDDWRVNDGILLLTLKDMSKEWKLPVPSKWETTGDDVTWTADHPIDIMLDIFQNQINVRDSGLLFDDFAAVKAATSDYKVTRTITGKTEDAKKLVEELRLLLFAFFIPSGDGKIGIKQFDSSEAAVVSFTDDNTTSIKWSANSKELINSTALYFNYDGSGNDESDFSEYDPGDNTASQIKFKAIEPFSLKDKWTRTAEASQISGLETKILDQFDDMPPAVIISCDAKDIAYEVGDMALVTTLNAPGNNGTGISDEKYLIASKNLDFLGDKIIFNALKVAL